LRGWRSARGKSQLALATEAGVSTRHSSSVETRRSSPSRDMVLMLAEALRAQSDAGGPSSLRNPARQRRRRADDRRAGARLVGPGERARAAHFSPAGLRPAIVNSQNELVDWTRLDMLQTSLQAIAFVRDAHSDRM